MVLPVLRIISTMFEFLFCIIVQTGDSSSILNFRIMIVLKEFGISAGCVSALSLPPRTHSTFFTLKKRCNMYIHTHPLANRFFTYVNTDWAYLEHLF